MLHSLDKLTHTILSISNVPTMLVNAQIYLPVTAGCSESLGE